MILDKLSESAVYEALHPLFPEAFAFLREAADKPVGRHELSGGMYASISDVTTHSAGGNDLEAHQSYIDIQYLIGGRSACGWAKTDELAVSVPYDSDKDVVFLRGENQKISVRDGDFYILFPSDAHEPHCTDEEPSNYRVVVVKVPVNQMA